MVTHYNKVRWIFVYIAEAHAVNEWPVRSPRCTHNNAPVIVEQSYNIEDRIKLALDFANQYNFLPKMYVSIPDLLINFELIYKPWPFRILGFDGSDITLATEPKDCEIRLEDVTAWIESN